MIPPWRAFNRWCVKMFILGAVEIKTSMEAKTRGSASIMFLPCTAFAGNQTYLLMLGILAANHIQPSLAPDNRATIAELLDGRSDLHTPLLLLHRLNRRCYWRIRCCESARIGACRSGTL